MSLMEVKVEFVLSVDVANASDKREAIRLAKTVASKRGKVLFERAGFAVLEVLAERCGE